MNEPLKNPATVPPIPGGKPAAENSKPVAGASVQPAPVVPPPAKPVALFGGHRGGGKKRADGLIAGSSEAKEADRKADAERKRQERANKKVAAPPARLPGVATPVTSPVVAVAGDESPVPDAVAGVVAPAAVAPAAFPMFVAWSQKKLEKAAKLLIKIGERVEGYFASKKVALLKLAPHREKIVLEQFKVDEAATADLSAALAEAATIELNKRRIGGAEHAHWVDVGLCVVEVVALKMKNWDTLDKLILEDRAEKAADKTEPKKL